MAADNPVIEKGYGVAIRRSIVGGPELKRAYVEVVTPSYFDLEAGDGHGQPLSNAANAPASPRSC
jgi:hypothetical protein